MTRLNIKAGVVGATGSAGAELVRLLTGPPQAELAAISSVSFTGQALSDIYPAYYHICDLVCGTQEKVVEKSDVAVSYTHLDVYKRQGHIVLPEFPQSAPAGGHGVAFLLIACGNQHPFFVDQRKGIELQVFEFYR